MNKPYYKVTLHNETIIYAKTVLFNKIGELSRSSILRVDGMSFSHIKPIDIKSIEFIEESKEMENKEYPESYCEYNPFYLLNESNGV